MAPSPVIVKTPPLWISFWLAFSTCIVLWDAGYCFLRPRSMPGGDLSWIWWPYNRVPYSLIDLVYGIPALERGDGFTNAQALMNLIEATLNVEYLYLRHTSPKTLNITTGDSKRPKYHPQAPLVGFATVLMTAAKTSLYFMQEYYCGFCSIKQNTLFDTLRFYVATNGVWLVMPLFVAVILGQFISNGLMRDASNQIAYSEWTSSPSSSSIEGKPTSSAGSVARGEAKSSKKVSSGYAVPSSGAALPLTFNVASSSVLVIGSNRLAATRAFALLEAGARVFVVSPLPLVQANDEIQHRVKENGVVYFQVDFQEVAQWVMFIKGKKIALACVADTLIGSSERKEGSVETIAMACKALGVPINVSDHAALSTFSFPATHRFSGADGPSNLQISVSTNGQGCRLGGRIKREIISKLPSTVGEAVDNVGRLRMIAKEKGKGKAAMSEEDPSTPLNDPVEQLGTPSLLHSVSKELQTDYIGKAKEDSQLRRMRWVHQMSEYYSFEALARMSHAEMATALDTWQGVPASSQPVLPHHDGRPLEQHGGPSRPKGKGRILLVGSGPGHPGLLTVAAHRALQSATLILSDKLVPAEVLALIPSTTALHIAKKFPGNNEGAQNELMVQALEAARSGETVVRLKQGDPFVYGRGGEEVLYFRQNGYEAIVIPGVTSAIAGPEMVGIPITQRGVAESMVLCTGVGRAGKSISLPGYVKPRSLVILMGVARIGSIVSTLVDPGSSGRDGAAYPDYLPIAVIERASSPDQRVIISTLRDIEAGIKSVEERPPGMMVVGWAVLALEGKGRVDVLDRQGDEEGISRDWMGGDKWRVSEGLGEGFAEYLEEIRDL